jgi:hypothetical protein
VTYCTGSEETKLVLKKNCRHLVTLEKQHPTFKHGGENLKVGKLSG